MTLLIGYGNPGRGDDGIGPEFARWATDQAFPGLDVISDFQLKVEYAIRISSASRVIFVDACTDADEVVRLDTLAPSDSFRIDSHTLHPAALLGLAGLLFEATPPAYILAIAGTEFEMFHEELSPAAKRNIAKAQRRFADWYKSKEREDAANNASRPSSTAMQ